MAILANVFGALHIPDDDAAYVQTFGQQAIYDATVALLGDHNADVNEMESLFVEDTTVNHVARFYLSTGGRLEKVTNETRALPTKAAGSWDVGFPLEEWGAVIAGNRVQMAYMSTGQYGRHIAQVLNSDINTRRHEILKRLFNNGGGAPIAWIDPIWGSINLQPLANGDATVYPPVIGAEINSTRNRYLTVTYASSAFSDTNDPITPMVSALEATFGKPQGGSRIVIFANTTDANYIQSNMTLFNPVQMLYQSFGANISQAVGYPENLPGRIIGEFAGRALISEWDWIPVGYLLGIHLGAQAPLRKRIDPPGLGLGSGLQLHQQRVNDPLRDAIWSNRFGYAVGNRLNGIVTQTNRSGSYQVPTGYSD